jgi:lantibiotic biosynthesis protein
MARPPTQPPAPRTTPSAISYRPLDHLVVRAPLFPVESYRALSARDSLWSPAWTDGLHPPGLRDLLDPPDPGDVPNPPNPRDVPNPPDPGNVPHRPGPLPGPPVGDGIPAAGLDAGGCPQAPSVRLALGLASPSLLAALDRTHPGDAGWARLEGKLLRYLIRMSTRPTPFGLFAGVGVAHWAERTDLVVAGPPRSRTRLDMAWLLRLVLRLEADPDLRRHLRLVANTGAFERNGRIHLSERAQTLGSVGGATGSVSVRATGAVRQALAAARQPIPYTDLAAGLLATVPGANPARVDQLLGQLCQATLLLTDLRPPLTGSDPAAWVAQRLAAAARSGGEIPVAAAQATRPTSVAAEPALSGGARLAAAQATRLGSLAADAAALDRVGSAAAAAGHARLAGRLGAGMRDGARSPLQVDARLDLRGGVHPAVGEAVAEAAALLLRMTPLPEGPPHLAGHRRAFLRRYGPDRTVPLLELLDPRFGLGPLGPASGAPVTARGGRTQLLLDLACRALRERQAVLELDEELVGRLATWDPDPARAPATLELYVGVAAPDRAAIDRGAFTLVLGHGPGASPAGRSLGRFADLLDPADRVALAETGRLAGRTRPGVVVAELVYLPRRLRQANVSVRPAVHDHELVVGTSPGVPADRVVPLEELVVGVADGRLRLWWPAGGAEVEVAAGHMLSPAEAPAVARFLAEVGRDGRAQLGGFSWGPAAGFPFLPRVQAGRVVLRPASWRLDPTAPVPTPTDPGPAHPPAGLAADGPGAFEAWLPRWRDEWGVPRYVQLGGGDRRLLLDLDDPAQAAQVRDELSRGRPLVLQEALPGPDQAWLPGPGGRHLTELVVPLALVRAPDRQDGPETTVASRRPGALPPPPRDQRLRVPGSDWLYLKLYGAREDEDELLAGPVRDLAEAAVDEGLASGWFFLRYADPDPHLRLRFRGAPRPLTAELLPRLCQWAGELVGTGRLERFGVDTYERELERYGGPDGMAAAEDGFAADSRCVAALLGCLAHGLGLDRVDLAVLAADDLLDSLGMDPVRRLGWYAGRVADRREGGPEHRRRKATLRPLLADPARLASVPGGPGVLDRLAGRRAALAPVAGRLAGLAAAGRLQGRSLDDLAASFVHLHCNRLLGPDPAAERLVLGLLLRTRESLARAPLASPR